MLKLTAMVYIMVGSVLAGSFVVAALTMGRMDATSISVAALIGALVALPVSWFVAGKLNKAIRPA
jgi:preprotein translocase subunit SecF